MDGVEPGIQPYTLGTSLAEPDQVFPSLAALARALVARRDALPGRPALATFSATLARAPLPGGACVSVRARDGSCGGRGAWLGYVFMPGPRPWERLMRALLAAEVEAAGGRRAA